MSLWLMKENSSAVVLSLDAKLHESHALRLSELGIRSNEIVFCIKHTPFRGPRMYLIGDSVFSLAEDIASSIYVSKHDPEAKSM